MELVNGSVSLDDAVAWLAQQRRCALVPVVMEVLTG